MLPFFVATIFGGFFSEQSFNSVLFESMGGERSCTNRWGSRNRYFARNSGVAQGFSKPRLLHAVEGDKLPADLQAIGIKQRVGENSFRFRQGNQIRRFGDNPLEQG